MNVCLSHDAEETRRPGKEVNNEVSGKMERETWVGDEG